jgi:hypothetical protein
VESRGRSTTNAKGALLAEEWSAEGALSADGGTEKVDVRSVVIVAAGRWENGGDEHLP